MTEEQKNQSQEKFTVPMAIVVAGVLVAVAVFFRPSAPSGSDVGTNEPVSPQAGEQANATPVPAQISFAEVSEDDHIRGSQDASITLIEYSDLECPFCRSFHPTVERVMEEYPGQVRWVYRHFPLEAIHPRARLAANATECAADQGKFWELTDYIFENTTSGADLEKEKLLTYATAVGVPNQATFASCLENQPHDDKVSADLADAQAAGGRGTPYTILVGPNGEEKPVSGAVPYETLKAQIDSLL